MESDTSAEIIMWNAGTEQKKDALEGIGVEKNRRGGSGQHIAYEFAIWYNQLVPFFNSSALACVIT